MDLTDAPYRNLTPQQKTVRATFKRLVREEYRRGCKASQIAAECGLTGPEVQATLRELADMATAYWNPAPPTPTVN